MESDKEAEDLFRRQVEGTLSDAWLSEREWVALRDAVLVSGLAEDRARAIYEEVARYTLATRIHEALADGQFSLDEEQDLKALAADLRIELTLPHEIAATLEEARQAWLLAEDAPPAETGTSDLPARGRSAAAFAAILARIWK